MEKDAVVFKVINKPHLSHKSFTDPWGPRVGGPGQMHKFPCISTSFLRVISSESQSQGSEGEAEGTVMTCILDTSEGLTMCREGLRIPK